MRPYFRTCPIYPFIMYLVNRVYPWLGGISGAPTIGALTYKSVSVRRALIRATGDGRQGLARWAGSVEAGLAFEAETAFGYLSFAAFMQMAAGLPDFKPLPKVELPGDSSLSGGAALSKEAFK